jgi:TRAP-type C4-dicarboxylate transport system substrate-binding protein
MSAPRRIALAATVLALVTAGLTACSPSAPAPLAVKRVVVLHIATDDDDTEPAGKQILHFAAEVKKLSHGSVTVSPSWHAAGDTPDWDQANAKLVQAGTAELGLIPSRAWDELGVTSLRALNAPFLLTTDEQVRTTVSGSLRTPLLAGLAKASVVGVDLFPEGLRHPFGQGEPLRGVGDYAGGLIRTPTSATVSAMFKAFGATTNDEELSPQHRGAESSYALTPGGVATGNVVFFPKVNALVANPKAFARLSAGQRQALRDAATRTRSWVLRTLPTDTAAATAFCKSGGSIAVASAAQVQSLRRAAQPVVRELEKDPGTRATIAAIRSQAPPPKTLPPVTRCS